MTKALIIGSNGQDGRCLTELLQSRGVMVTGISRASGINISAQDEVDHLVSSIKPDEIYFLAAFHHSSEQAIESEIPLWEHSIQTHLTAPVLLLESVRKHCPKAKVFYASSSLVFGASNGVLNETSPIKPDSPYAITKAAGMQLCQYYREKHQVFASVGILFNHESEYRGSKFLTKKIAAAVSKIQKGSTEKLKLGSLSAQVDWGYARDYVEAMTRILKLDAPADFVISSGKLHSVQQFVDKAFLMAGLKAADFVEENPGILKRKIPARLGDCSKLREMTGWTPSVNFDKLVEILLKSEGVHLV